MAQTCCYHTSGSVIKLSNEIVSKDCKCEMEILALNSYQTIFKIGSFRPVGTKAGTQGDKWVMKRKVWWIDEGAVSRTVSGKYV